MAFNVNGGVTFMKPIRVGVDIDAAWLGNE
jgi:hypothetical protein